MLAFVWSGEERAAPLLLPMRNIARTMNENKRTMKRIERCVLMSHSARRRPPLVARAIHTFSDSEIYSRRAQKQGTEWKCVLVYGMHLLWKRFVAMKIDGIRIENKLSARATSSLALRCARNKIFSGRFKFLRFLRRRFCTFSPPPFVPLDCLLGYFGCGCGADAPTGVGSAERMQMHV